MRRIATLIALSFAAVAAYAGAPATVNVHLDLSPSVAERLHDGTISAIKVMAMRENWKPGVMAETISDTAVLRELTPPGNYTVRAFLLIKGTLYVVDPDGTAIDVQPGSESDVHVPIDSLIVEGTTLYHGQPLRGQMSIRPSEHKPGNWGFAVPFDKDGKFAFPLPHAGNWDLDIASRALKGSAKLTNYEFGPSDVTHEITIDVP
jgi:hypothetical protein